MKSVFATAASLIVVVGCNKPQNTTVAATDSLSNPPPADVAASAAVPKPPDTVYVQRPAPPPPPPAPVRREPRRDRQIDRPADRPARDAAPEHRGGTLPSGTSFTAVALDSIRSGYTQVGDRIRVRVDQDVSENGRVVIPAGSIVALEVTSLAGGHNRSAKGTLELVARDVNINGISYPLAARASDYQYEMKVHGVGASEVAKTGAGAAVGALLGHMIGGRTGTIVGAVAGGAGGAAIASRDVDTDLIVHEGSTITLALSEAFSRG